MIKIFNGTTREITIFAKADATFDEKTRRLILITGATPVAVISTSGQLLNAIQANGEAPDLDTNIPLVGAVQFTDADTLPENFDLYIVSNLYRSALIALGRDTSKIATIFGSVYANTVETNPIGATALAVG
jgi:hypothetical protein